MIVKIITNQYVNILFKWNERRDRGLQGNSLVEDLVDAEAVDCRVIPWLKTLLTPRQWTAGEFPGWRTGWRRVNGLQGTLGNSQQAEWIAWSRWGVPVRLFQVRESSTGPSPTSQLYSNCWQRNKITFWITKNRNKNSI